MVNGYHSFSLITENAVTFDKLHGVKCELFPGNSNILLFVLMHMEGETPKL
jgi:hypothetical protein